MSWLSRLANVFRPSRVARDLDDELTSHREERIDALLRDGLSREDAEAAAARRFGNALRLREESRDIKILPWLDAVGRDVRLGLRMLRKDALVSCAAIASLALGLGACAAAFSLVDALILRPLPVQDPDRLIYLTYPSESPDQPESDGFSTPLFERLRAAAHGQIELFVMSRQVLRDATFPDSAGQKEPVRSQYVSGSAFELLGVRPALGRLIARQDDLRPGDHPVAVLSHAYWQRRFGGDPTIVGRAFRLQGSFANDVRPLLIVGVAEAGFTGVEPGVATDVWIPTMMYDQKAFTAMHWNWFRTFGRLAPGVEAARVQPMLDAAFKAKRAELVPPGAPQARRDRFLAIPLHLQSAANGPSQLRREFQRPLWILAIVVSLVLLIAGSNIANLFGARAAAREREMALRLSIGASRARLIQQVLIESALLAVAASALALLFASIAGPAVVRMLAPASDPAYLDLRVTWRLLAFVAGAGLLSMMLCGLAPALRASNAAPIGALKEDGGRMALGVGRGAGRGARGRRGLPRPLVALQVGFSLTVLFVAGLLVLSFGKLITTELGFARANVLLLSIDTERVGGSEQVRALAPQLRDRLRHVAGVEAVGASAWALFGGASVTARIQLPGGQIDDREVHYLEVAPGFFDAMRIQMRDGRDFEPRDLPGAPRPAGAGAAVAPLPVVVNEAFVRRYFPATRAVGALFQRGSGAGLLQQEIVGVVTDAKYDNPGQPAPPTAYIPLRGMGTLQVRTAADPTPLIPLLRQEVAAVHPALRVSNVRLQSTLVDNALLRERLLAILSGFFAVVGLLLAAIGLYGVLSYTVVRRTREIGIRVALGARPGRVVCWVLGEVALTTLAGIAGGLAGGVLLARYVERLLYEVKPLDPLSLALPIVSLVAAGLLAAWPAARRAARVDPVIALRSE